MTGYLVNHQKKNKIFRKREKELKHAIAHNFSHEKILKAVEKLRVAKLNVFKSEFSKKSVLPASHYTPDENAKHWESLPAEEIIHEYSKQKT